MQVRVLGVVQGVGFRPFVFRLARELRLAGSVLNDGQGVTVEAEGPREALLEFLRRLRSESPPAAILYAVDHRFLVPTGAESFRIVPSRRAGPARAWILPDLATCAACRAEIFDSADRRHRYPFTNCTHCGPRFTILDALPYDRPRTSMRSFSMCRPCRREYETPEDRRFHAQPNACPDCGPRLELREAGGERLALGERALRLAEDRVRRGQILALKGLGGFHIVVDARNERAVSELRRRKRRPFKAFALMYPGLELLRRHVELPNFAEPLLQSSQAPILILPRTARAAEELAPSVAPRSPNLGVFLPATPLHWLLLGDLGFPVVATSGNVSDQPIVHGDEQALRDLRDLCDAFLLHDRPIRRPADDSVLHVVQRPSPMPQMLRRARGYTPLPLLAPRELPCLLALGGHMNVVFALSRGREVILSQHLGDLDDLEARRAYECALDDLQRLYEVRPEAVVHDLHPDYYTTELARNLGLPRVAVQHHHAHLAACMLEHQLEEPVLGLTWDGTGYGADGTIWGGECLFGDAREFRRVASLRPFRLPGGEAAVRETWRTGLALLRECYGEAVPLDLPMFGEVPQSRVEGVLELLDKGVRSPVTTSAGRLFDGVAALLGVSLRNAHPAQSPQLLEWLAWGGQAEADGGTLPLVEDEPWQLDWRELVRGLVERFRSGEPVEELAAAFHAALADGALRVVERVGCERIVLAGGVFCNRLLTEELLLRLQARGCSGYVHSQLPPTDGSLAAGQLWIAAQGGGQRTPA